MTTQTDILRRLRASHPYDADIDGAIAAFDGPGASPEQCETIAAYLKREITHGRGPARHYAQQALRNLEALTDRVY